MILLIDNYDSFTYNLSQYLRMLGEGVVVTRNDDVTVEQVATLNPRLIVISPGPKGPSQTGNCLKIIDTYYRSVPILGICLGMQAIAYYFGGKIVKANEPVHGKVRNVHHDGKGLFSGLNNPLRVTRYHSLLVEAETLPGCLKITGRSDTGEIMGLEHREYPVSGVQFHPEAFLTEQGLELLGNALAVSV